MKRFLWMALGVLLLPQPVLALPRLLLVWQFPREYTPQPTSFQVSYTSSEAPDTTIEAMTVAVSAPGACAAAGAAGDDSYCALWPTCPAPGNVILFWIQALWDGKESKKSNNLGCRFTADRPCECQDIGTQPTAESLAAEVAAAMPKPPPPETQPQHWTDALGAILSAVPAPAA